jgi:SRSO17 transposase
VDVEEQDKRIWAAWQRLELEDKVRQLRFGPRPRKEEWNDPRKRKLPPRAFDVVCRVQPEELEGYVQIFSEQFGRRDTVRQAKLYLLGLLSDLPRKNPETMEAAIPGATQQSLRNFLANSPWSAEELDRARVLDALQRAGCLDQPLDVIVDETGWPKKGQLSVGVARQYLGSLGKTDNGQVMVSLHLCCGAFDVPGTAELYLPPKRWGGDDEACRQRRAAARVPEDWVFRTKPELAKHLLQRVQGWGLRIRRVHGDCLYAELPLLRDLHEQGLEVALGIRSNTTVRLADEPWLPAEPPPPYSGRGRPRQGKPSRPRLRTPEELRQALSPDSWHPVAYRQDVNGKPLIREFVAMRAHVVHKERRKRSTPAPEAESPELWLLLERPLGPGPHAKDEYKQYVISGPKDMTLNELAEIAHVRPVIERNSYENGKQQTGLADYQGRTWPGLHHHVAMVYMALTWLMLLRRPLPDAASPPSSGTQGSVPSQRPAIAHIAGNPDVPIPIAAPATVSKALPRQHWESVQQVHRTLRDWFVGMGLREHLLALSATDFFQSLRAKLAPLPTLGPLLTTGP